MATIKPLDDEDYGRMVFLVYGIVVFALIGVGLLTYLLYHLLLS